MQTAESACVVVALGHPLVGFHACSDGAKEMVYRSMSR